MCQSQSLKLNQVTSLFFFCAWQGFVEACETVSVSWITCLKCTVTNSDSLWCSYCRKVDCISFILAQSHFLLRITYPVEPSVTPVVFCHVSVVLKENIREANCCVSLVVILHWTMFAFQNPFSIEVINHLIAFQKSAAAQPTSCLTGQTYFSKHSAQERWKGALT